MPPKAPPSFIEKLFEHRELIERLYVSENRPASEVCRILSAEPIGIRVS